MKKAFVQSLTKQQERPERTAIRADDAVSAVLRKLQPAMNNQNKQNGMDSRAPAPNLINRVIQDTAMNVNDAKNFRQILPDMELARRILTNSIISPNDMMSRELTHQHDADLIGELGGVMLDFVREHFESVYKIETEMTTIIERILFDSGSYPVAVIPESSIDDMLNGDKNITTESISRMFKSDGGLKNLGYLGHTIQSVEEAKGFKTSLENFMNLGSTVGEINPWLLSNEDFGIYITDNPDVLKMPALEQKQRASLESRVTAKYGRNGLGLEDYTVRLDGQAMSDGAIEEVYRKNSKSASFKPVVMLKTKDELDRPTIGEPLKIVFPSESIVTVHRPGKPDDILGAFAIADQYGNFIRSTLNENYYNNFSGNTEQARGMQSMLIANTRRQIEGRKATEQDDVMAETEMTLLFTEIVEKDLKSRLKNGIYGDNVEIAKPADVYRIMMHRSMQKQRTQIVFIPASMFTYFAFQYNEFGTGTSLIEETKILCSLRSMMLFANTTAAVKNSVHHVAMNVRFDDQDANPLRTLEYIKNEYAKNRRSSLPYGRANPTDINTFLANAGVQLNVENHPAFPGTNVQIENLQTNVSPVDTELDESLKRRHLMAWGIAPEVVEAAEAVDFATSIISSNLMLAKIALERQIIFCHHLTDHLRKYIRNHGGLLKRLAMLVEKNKDMLKESHVSMENTVSDVVEYFINHYTVSLPEPDLSRLEIQMAEFDAYSEALDKVLPTFISDEMFPSDLMGEAGNSVSQVISIVKAMLLRRHLQMNNVMPEVFDLLSPADGTGTAFNLLDTHTQYMEVLGKAVDSFIAKSKKVREANDRQMEVQGLTGEGSDGGGSSDDGGNDQSNEEDSGEGGGSDPSKGDDGGFDDDFNIDDGSGEEAADSEPEAEAEPKEEKEEAPKEEKDDKADEKEKEKEADKADDSEK